jgi:hypothetical protein
MLLRIKKHQVKVTAFMAFLKQLSFKFQFSAALTGHLILTMKG